MMTNKRIAIAAPILLIVMVLWIYPITFKDPRLSAYVRFEAIVTLLFAVALWDVNKWISGFIVAAFFSSLIPIPTTRSMQVFDMVLIGVIWFYFLVKYIEKNQVYHLFNAICILSLASVGLITCQTLGFDPIYRLVSGEAGTSPTGFLVNANEVSSFFAMSLPAFFRPRWKWFIPLIFLGLTLAHSTGGAAAAAIMTIAYLFLKNGRNAIKRNLVQILLLVICWFTYFHLYVDPHTNFKDGISRVLQLDQTTVKQKESLWITFLTPQRGWWIQKGLELYKQRPILGYGIGHWMPIFKKLRYSPGGIPQGKWSTMAHNEYIQGLFELGIIFPLLVAGYFVGIFRKYKKEAILSVTAMGIIALNSAVYFLFHIAQTAILALTFMAIFEIQARDEK